MKHEPALILLVEDEQAHAEVISRILSESRFVFKLMHVSDGQAALDYLFRRNEFSSPAHFPRPDMILLDLRLPKLGGLDVLKAIKANDDLSQIPVVMLSTSAAQSDVENAYSLHANSYVVKPADFIQFRRLIEAVCSYWLEWNQNPI